MDEIRQGGGHIQVLRAVLRVLPPFSGECWRPKERHNITQEAGTLTRRLVLPLDETQWEGDLPPDLFCQATVHYSP